MKLTWGAWVVALSSSTFLVFLKRNSNCSGRWLSFHPKHRSVNFKACCSVSSGCNAWCFGSVSISLSMLLALVPHFPVILWSYVSLDVTLVSRKNFIFHLSIWCYFFPFRWLCIDHGRMVSIYFSEGFFAGELGLLSLHPLLHSKLFFKSFVLSSGRFLPLLFYLLCSFRRLFLSLLS